MAAVESTSVVSVLTHDCCLLLGRFGGLSEKFSRRLESSSRSQLLALSSLQNAGFF